MVSNFISSLLNSKKSILVLLLFVIAIFVSTLPSSSIRITADNAYLLDDNSDARSRRNANSYLLSQGVMSRNSGESSLEFNDNNMSRNNEESLSGYSESNDDDILIHIEIDSNSESSSEDDSDDENAEENDTRGSVQINDLVIPIEDDSRVSETIRDDDSRVRVRIRDSGDGSSSSSSTRISVESEN
jgi:hypothetical protein